MERYLGLSDKQSEATLLARQHAVLADNHARLRKAIANDYPPPPIYSPYSPAITAEPYTNGEPYNPRNAE